MLFDAIFLTLFFLTWLLLGATAWLVISIRRRAHGALWALPFALLGGAGGGVFVPLLGLDDGWGLAISMPAASLGGGLLAWAAFRVWDDRDLGARFARWATPGTAPAPRSSKASPLDSEQPGATLDSDQRTPADQPHPESD